MHSRKIIVVWFKSQRCSKTINKLPSVMIVNGTVMIVVTVYYDSKCNI